MRFTTRYPIETGVDGFWSLFFDDEFQLALLRSFQAAATRQVVEQRTDASGLMHMRIEYAAPADLPSLAKKLFGNGEYTEVGRYDANLRKYCAATVPKVGADKIVIHTELSAEPLSATRCERVLTMETTVKVFGLAKMLESFLEREQRQAQKRTVDFTNAWIQDAANAVTKGI
jgi:hypothetical protein